MGSIHKELLEKRASTGMQHPVAKWAGMAKRADWLSDIGNTIKDSYNQNKDLYHGIGTGLGTYLLSGLLPGARKHRLARFLASLGVGAAGYKWGGDAVDWIKQQLPGQKNPQPVPADPETTRKFKEEMDAQNANKMDNMMRQYGARPLKDYLTPEAVKNRARYEKLEEQRERDRIQALNAEEMANDPNMRIGIHSPGREPSKPVSEAERKATQARSDAAFNKMMNEQKRQDQMQQAERGKAVLADLKRNAGIRDIYSAFTPEAIKKDLDTRYEDYLRAPATQRNAANAYANPPARLPGQPRRNPERFATTSPVIEDTTDYAALRARALAEEEHERNAKRNELKKQLTRLKTKEGIRKLRASGALDLDKIKAQERVQQDYARSQERARTLQENLRKERERSAQIARTVDKGVKAIQSAPGKLKDAYLNGQQAVLDRIMGNAAYTAPDPETVEMSNNNREIRRLEQALRDLDNN